MASDDIKQAWKVPEPTLRRLPWYLAFVKLMKGKGEAFISSTQIAKEINVDPSQVPTPNRNALCWDVKPRKSSSTSTNALISYPTLVFPELAFVKLMKGKGEAFISSTQIAKEINVDPSQVAKRSLF